MTLNNVGLYPRGRVQFQHCQLFSAHCKQLLDWVEVEGWRGWGEDRELEQWYHTGRVYHVRCHVMSCDAHEMSCDVMRSCDAHEMSCDAHVMSCESCDAHEMSCDAHEMSCDAHELSCDVM